MTTSFLLESQPFRRGPSPMAAVVVGVASVAAVLTLFGAGVTFFALAIAGPMAIPVAEAYHVHMRVADAVIAGRLADFWPVFAVASIASFGAAARVAAKVVGYLSPTTEGSAGCPLIDGARSPHKERPPAAPAGRGS